MSTPPDFVERRLPPAAPLARFGLFGDVHYAHRVYGDRHCEEAPAKMGACVETFQQADLAFVACLGDLIDAETDRASDLANARTMSGLLAACPGPRHWVVGNHDVEHLSKADFLAACGAAHGPFYSFDSGGVHFLVLDGNCHADGTDFCAGDFSWDQAWVSPAQIEWLAADLADAGPRPSVVLIHENVDDRLWQEALDPHVVRNAAQVRRVLERTGNVRAVLQAHYHPGLLSVQQGIPYLALRAMVVGSGTEHTAYAVITVHADGSVDVEGFGQQESVVLRRPA